MTAGRPVRIRVWPEVCIASGECVRVLPQVFDQREEDGTVRLRVAHPAAGLAPQVREAALTCPSGAIELLPD